MTGQRYPYVALEGVNGAGKSFARDQLERWFRQQGHDVFMYGQYGWLVPWASAVITAFRERRGGYSTEQLMEAHIADRKAALAQVVAENLACGPVIGDRSLISDAPYLDALEGIRAETVLDRYSRAGLTFPDITIYLDLEPEAAVERIALRGENLKRYETPHTLRAVSTAYRRIVDNGTLARLTTVIEADSRNLQRMLPELEMALTAQRSAWSPA
jgi:dTMP kinase